MKKNLLAIALLVCGIAGLSAQTPASQACSPDNCNTPNCAAPNCAPGENARRCASPFEGLNLTAEQQTKLDALKSDCKASAEKARTERKNKRNECRQARLAKIKEILTPEQYVQFLENAFVSNGRHQGPARSGDNRIAHHRKGNCHKAHKSDCNARTQQARPAK